jgi:hypothetical protein
MLISAGKPTGLWSFSTQRGAEVRAEVRRGIGSMGENIL